MSKKIYIPFIYGEQLGVFTEERDAKAKIYDASISGTMIGNEDVSINEFELYDFTKNIYDPGDRYAPPCCSACGDNIDNWNEYYEECDWEDVFLHEKCYEKLKENVMDILRSSLEELENIEEGYGVKKKIERVVELLIEQTMEYLDNEI